MMELERSGESRVSHVSVATEHGHERQRVTHEQALMLTITPEKIDRVMCDVQAQIEALQHNLAKLRLARARIALLQAKERGQQSHGVGLVTAAVCTGATT
jgi:hypothetical protein